MAVCPLLQETLTKNLAFLKCAMFFDVYSCVINYFPSDFDDAVDEEDLDLIEENLGINLDRVCEMFLK